MEHLRGRVALVSGSSRGIGRAIAIALAGAGASVAINYRTRAADAGVVEQEIRGLGVDGVAIQADVSRAEEVARLVRLTEDRLGPVDILVNNAGIARPRPIDAVSDQDWDDHLAANLTSCFLMIRAVLSGMRARRWGRIINLSSVAAQVGGVVGPHYAAAKAGVIGLTHFYAAHLAAEGITVNAIAPALIETEMVAANPNARKDRIPVGRFGEVSEVADVAAMLVSNGYITGQTINVNGGMYFGT
jgi:3-oxoacyl-[acyl-carrier protein] reductase